MKSEESNPVAVKLGLESIVNVTNFSLDAFLYDSILETIFNIERVPRIASSSLTVATCCRGKKLRYIALGKSPTEELSCFNIVSIPASGAPKQTRILVALSDFDFNSPKDFTTFSPKRLVRMISSKFELLRNLARPGAFLTS